MKEFGEKTNKKNLETRPYSCSFWKGGSLIGYSRWFQLVLEPILGPNEHDAVRNSVGQTTAKCHYTP